MRILSIRRIGVILVLLGILIGFFGFWNQELGSIGFPFAAEITGLFSLFSLGLLEFTSTWWSAKIWGLVIGAVGLLMVKFG